MTEQDIKRIVQQEIKAQNAASRFGFTQIPRHLHNGVDSPKINQANVTPSTRASGSISMAHSGQYRLGIISNPTAIQFYGNAVKRSSTIVFNLSSASDATMGAIYSNNGQLFTVNTTISGGTSLSTDGTNYPEASGVLTLESGTGDSPIAYTSYDTPAIIVRAFCVGSAQIGGNYYFQPDTTGSVVVGGPIQDIIQSSSYVGATGTGSGTVTNFRALADEGHIVDVEYPSQGSIVARATVSSYTNSAIFIDVTLSTFWEINGNWIVT